MPLPNAVQGPHALGRGAEGQAEVEKMKGNRETSDHNRSAGWGCGSELTSLQLRPSHVFTCLASGKGLPPALGMTPDTGTPVWI